MNGYVLVNILGALLIVTSLSVMLTRSPRTSAFEYAAQSCVLVAIFITLGMTTGSTELFTWSFRKALNAHEGHLRARRGSVRVQEDGRARKHGRLFHHAGALHRACGH